MRLSRAAALSVLIALAASAASAFDSNEHRLIARNGLQLAKEYCATRTDCVLTGVQQVQLSHFADPHSNLEYGALVSSVDYRLNPLQLLQRYGPQDELPENAADLDPHLVRLLTNGGSTFFRAATSNDTHFQGELVTGIRNWHAYAVSVAAGTKSVKTAPTVRDNVRGNLFGALLVNSIADHFLQDFFAPGHIITPRFGLHDAVALSMHNKYNTLGAWFHINRTVFNEDLLPLFTFLPSSSLSKERFMDAYRTVAEDDYIPLWGDSQLSRSKAQELLMVLVEARSVLDILQSASTQPVNRFLDVSWFPMTKSEDATGRTVYDFAAAGLPFGKYVNHDYKGHQPTAGSVLSFSFGAELLTGLDRKRLHQDKRTTARRMYVLEALAVGTPPISADPHPTDATHGEPVHFDVYRQWGVNLGLVLANNATETARGAMVRGVYALPLMHAQFSANVAEKKYTYKDESKRRTSYGIQLQSGFSLLLFDLGAAREWTYGVRGVLKPELAIRFGASITGPSSSIPWIRSLEWKLNRERREREERADRERFAKEAAAP